MASVHAVRAIWVGELYKTLHHNTEWLCDVVASRRFAAVECALRQRAARLKDESYVPLASLADDSVLQAFAATEGVTILGAVKHGTIAPAGAPIANQVSPIRSAGELLMLNVLTDEKTFASLGVTASIYTLPPCDCSESSSTARFGVASPSPLRPTTSFRLLAVLVCSGSITGSAPSATEALPEVVAQAKDTHDLVESLLHPLLPRHSSEWGEGSSNVYDALHRDLCRNSVRGCHPEIGDPKFMVDLNRNTPWQQLVASLIASRLPMGRLTTAPPDTWPTLGELLKDSHPPEGAAELLAKCADRRYLGTKPQETDELFPNVVTIDLVQAAHFGRADTDDEIRVASFFFVDCASFPNASCSADRRALVSTGHWTTTPNGDDSGLNSKPVFAVESNPSLLVAPRSVLLRRCVELLPCDTPLEGVESQRCPRGVAAIMFRFSPLAWQRQTSAMREVLPHDAHSKNVLHALSTTSESLLSSFAHLLFQTVDLTHGKKASKLPVASQFAQSTHVPALAAVSSTDPNILRADRPFLTSLKVVPPNLPATIGAVEEHTLTLALRLSLDSQDSIFHTMNGGTRGAGSVSEFRASCVDFTGEPSFGKSKLNAEQLAVATSVARHVMMCHMIVRLRLHEPAVRIVAHDLRPSIGSWETNVHTDYATSSGVLLGEWSLPPWSRRVNGFEFKLTGPLRVTRVDPTGCEQQEPTTASPLALSAELEFVMLLLSPDGSTVDQTDASPLATSELIFATCVRSHSTSVDQTKVSKPNAGAGGVQGRSSVPPALVNGASLTSAMATTLAYAICIDPPPPPHDEEHIAEVKWSGAETLSSDVGIRKVRALVALPPAADSVNGGGFVVWNALHPKCRMT